MKYYKLFKYVLILVGFALFLYLFRRISFDLGRYCFHHGPFERQHWLPLEEKTGRAVSQWIIDCLYVVMIWAVFNRYAIFRQHYFKFFSLAPFFTDLSDMVFDKTCWKPWYHLPELIWYLPLRLALWFLMFCLFGNFLKRLQQKEVILIAASLILYTFLKPF